MGYPAVYPVFYPHEAVDLELHLDLPVSQLFNLLAFVPLLPDNEGLDVLIKLECNFYRLTVEKCPEGA